MKNVLFVSLGCDKNLVDSEKMLGLLNEAGYRVAQEESEADAIVVNTCCFIHDAKEESVETILEMAEWKKKGRLKALIVTGCMAQRYQDEIQQEIPEVDAVIGTTGYTEIVPILDEILAEAEASQKEAAVEEPKEKSFVNCCPSIDLLPASLADKRVVTTGGYTAYLKIAEGCNKRCTYCIIPWARGTVRSQKPEVVIEQVKQLVEHGQVATPYVDNKGNIALDMPFNPNGSMLGIEGITSPDGRVLGKMGHSERIGENLYKNVPGNFDQKIFESGVKYFK